MSQLYEALLGRDWAKLAPVTRHLHSPDPAVLFEGRVDIIRGRNLLAGAIAELLSLPRAGQSLPALVRVSRVEHGELLERWYDGRHFATLQGREAGLLTERFGPFQLSFRLRVEGQALAFDAAGVKLWGMDLPAMLRPHVEAREAADGEAHLFDVALGLPLIGLIVRYRGRLTLSTD